MMAQQADDFSAFAPQGCQTKGPFCGVRLAQSSGFGLVTRAFVYVGLVNRDDTAGSVRVNLDIGKACAFQKATLGRLDRLDCGTSCGGAVTMRSR